MNILGIDSSLNSPAFVIINTNQKISKDNINYFIGGQLVSKKDNPHYIYLKYVSDNKHIVSINKQLIITEKLKNIIKDFDIQYAAIEGYSYMSSGAGIYQLAETAGLIKSALYSMNIPFKIYEPSLIRQTACGKGNAKKDKVKEGLINNYNIPIEDIVVKTFNL